jgi:decaprenylphospho-beta-D-ribofuranose 2-oxidase
MGSFLAVLKRCGDDTVMLPFCKKGYTLALDIPHRGPETLRRLEALDLLVMEFGGRIYLTKDARLPKEAFRAMYPEWKGWMDTIKLYNPQGLGRSLMSERLGLWETP